MRERLIELLNNYEKEWRVDFPVTTEDLADYLLAEGVIVPPVKIGQKVYIIGWCNDIEEFVVRDVHLFTNDKGECSYRFMAVIEGESDIYFADCWIGNTVFLTREEAEKALAERIK